MTTNVFISTVGQELSSARMKVASALSSSGFGPVWCEYPENSSEDLIFSTRATIDRCNAVIQIVGDSYGPEPSQVQPPFGRISYAQYEVLYAIQSRKPVFFLLAGPRLPRDCAATVIDSRYAGSQVDLDERGICQRTYREKCESLTRSNKTIESFYDIRTALSDLNDYICAPITQELAILLRPESYQTNALLEQLLEDDARIKAAATSASRELHFFLLVDHSASMSGPKIDTVNRAIRSFLVEMESAVSATICVQVMVRAIRFSGTAAWHIGPQPVPINKCVWEDLAPESSTATDEAIRLLASELDASKMPLQALPPVCVLISDGCCNDYESYRRAMDEMLRLPWGRSAIRLAVALGDKTTGRSTSELAEFVSNPEIGVFSAENPASLIKVLRWTSISAGILSTLPQDGQLTFPLATSRAIPRTSEEELYGEGGWSDSPISQWCESIDTPGLCEPPSHSHGRNPIPDHASWKRRIVTSSTTRGDSPNIAEERKRIRQQIDESRISAENLLRSFPSECVSFIDQSRGRINTREVEKLLHAAERKLESHLQTVMRNSIGSNADHITYTTVLASDQSARINVGTAAGATIGSVLLPGLGGIIGATIGGLLSGMMAAPSATGLKESVGKRATEFVRQLEAEVQRLLSQIERDRLQQLANSQSSSEKGEKVEVSVFSEERVQRASQTLIQVFVHPNSERDAVEVEAARRDEASVYRGRHTLGVDISCGDVISLHLTANGIVMDEPLQEMTWQGQMECLSFAFIVPKDAQLGKIICTLTVRVLDVPIGYIRFTINIVEASTASRPLLVGDVAHRYGRAFISYASNDLNEVLKRIQMLRIQQIEFFQDLLTLQPGEKWEARIYQEIESSDLFLLFWSSAALASEWVEREWRHAIKCRGADDANPPDIHPVIIEGPPVAEPPEELRRFHFRDFLACLSQYEKK